VAQTAAHANEQADSVDDFCRAHYARLFGALRLYCGDAGLAEELTQEALARVVRHWPQVREMDSPAAWVHRVGLNLANSSFRRRSAVRQAVRALPPRQREAVVLRYFLDVSVRDAAAQMGCAEGTVKGLLFDAVRSLRMGGLEVDDDD
jgi:DNA-directed RNA polymerase specialized sigma24 family protein